MRRNSLIHAYGINVKESFEYIKGKAEAIVESCTRGTNEQPLNGESSIHEKET
jgi:hypothetical protein